MSTLKTTVFTIPQTSIPTGTTSIPATSLPASITSLAVFLEFQSSQTPSFWPNPGPTLSISLEVSYDNRQTWSGGGGVTGMVGGPQTDRRGNELLGGGFIATYQQPPTDVRGSLTVTNGPLLTAGTVTVS